MVGGWNCNCYLRNVQDLLADGKTPHERQFGGSFEGPVTLLGAMVEYHPISVRARLHQFGKKVLPGTLLGFALIAGRIWKGDILVADIEELENMDASEIHPRRLNAKRSVTATKGRIFKIPNSRWYSKIVRKRPRIPRPHSKAGTTCWEWRSQWRTSTRTGGVATDRNKS